MVSFLFFTFLLVATLAALVNWRLGLALLILVGATQDPVRKIMPGAPSLMVMAFVPVWLASLFGSMGVLQAHWQRVSRFYPVLPRAVGYLLLAFLLATAVLFYNYGISAWKVALVGNFTYILPLLSLLVGFAYARSEADVCRFIRVYCLVTALMLTGGILEVTGAFPEWKALGTSVLGTHWIKYVSWGHTIDLIAGFYRSPDIMGWHASVLAMLSLSMALYGKAGSRWFWLSLAAWGGLLVLICGRNKMLGMTIVWGAVVSLIYFYYGRMGKLIAMAGAGGLLIAAITLMSGEINLNQDYILYASNFTGGKVMGSSPLERLDTEVIATTLQTYKQSGFFGKGIGISTQGIQHLGLHIKRSWQESGLSRLLVELGVPGLLAALFFVWSMLQIFRRMISTGKGMHDVPVLQTVLMAFTIANMSNFAISHQVFNDGFVLVILTLFVGFLFASPGWYSKKRDVSCEV